MLTVNTLTPPWYFTPAPEDRMPFFPNTFISLLCATTIWISYLSLKLCCYNVYSAVPTRHSTVSWHNPHHYYKSLDARWRQHFEVIISALDQDLFLKLRHSSAESDVEDDLCRGQRSAVMLGQAVVSLTNSSDRHQIYPSLFRYERAWLKKVTQNSFSQPCKHTHTHSRSVQLHSNVQSSVWVWEQQETGGAVGTFVSFKETQINLSRGCGLRMNIGRVPTHLIGNPMEQMWILNIEANSQKKTSQSEAL